MKKHDICCRIGFFSILKGETKTPQYFFHEIEIFNKKMNIPFILDVKKEFTLSKVKTKLTKFLSNNQYIERVSPGHFLLFQSKGHGQNFVHI